jgi:hypothetical protein
VPPETALDAQQLAMPLGPHVAAKPTHFGPRQTLSLPQFCGDVHVPQETVRFVPQLSGAVTLPQFLLRRVQNAGSDSGTHSHRLEAVHVLGNVHVPQDATVRLTPQLSGAVTLPQVAPSREQNAVSVSDGHTQTLLTVHVWGNVQVPHETVRPTPQLSAAVRLLQFLPCLEQNSGSVSGTQAQALVAPHVWGNVHVPHDTTVREVPQLSVSVTLPQVALSREHNAPSVSGTQAHTWFPPHV